jgi:RND family efflux transporter MFP subunit
MQQENNTDKAKIKVWQKAAVGVLVALSLFAAGYISSDDDKAVENQQEPASGDAVSVVTQAVVIRKFERFTEVQGNCESKNLALVSPRIAGVLENFYVDEGDVVTAGKTKLFTTDSVKTAQAVEMAKHLLDVEQCAKREAQANLQKVKADFDKAEVDYKRFKRLLTKAAVTADAFEQQQSRYKQLKAVVKLAKANVDLADANVKMAQAALAISTKDLADTLITAPISGKVSHRFQEPGEMGDPGVAALRIDDTSLIEVSAFLPSRYYAEVVAGKTKIEVFIAGRNIGRYPVFYKSPTINPKLRTFEIKCLLETPDEKIAAGAMANIRVVFEAKDGLAVRSVSVQQRSGKNVIFVVRDAKAHQVQVETGLDNDGWTEVKSDEIKQGSLVVSMGQDMIDDGETVSVQREGVN